MLNALAGVLITSHNDILRPPPLLVSAQQPPPLHIVEHIINTQPSSIRNLRDALKSAHQLPLPLFTTSGNWRAALKSGEGLPYRLSQKGKFGKAIGFLTSRQILQWTFGCLPDLYNPIGSGEGLINKYNWEWNYTDLLTNPYWQDWTSTSWKVNKYLLGDTNRLYRIRRQHEDPNDVVLEPHHTVVWDRSTGSTVIYQGDDDRVMEMIKQMYTIGLLAKEELTIVVLPSDEEGYMKQRLARKADSEHDQFEQKDEEKIVAELAKYKELIRNHAHIYANRAIAIENDTTGRRGNISETSFVAALISYATLQETYHGIPFRLDGNTNSLRFPIRKALRDIFELKFSQLLQEALYQQNTHGKEFILVSGDVGIQRTDDNNIQFIVTSGLSEHTKPASSR
jgi:hypothetical protein